MRETETQRETESERERERMRRWGEGICTTQPDSMIYG